MKRLTLILIAALVLLLPGVLAFGVNLNCPASVSASAAVDCKLSLTLAAGETGPQTFQFQFVVPSGFTLASPAVTSNFMSYSSLSSSVAAVVFSMNPLPAGEFATVHFVAGTSSGTISLKDKTSGDTGGTFDSNSVSVTVGAVCTPSCPAASTICSGTTVTSDSCGGNSCSVAGTKTTDTCAAPVSCVDPDNTYSPDFATSKVFNPLSLLVATTVTGKPISGGTFSSDSCFSQSQVDEVYCYDSVTYSSSIETCPSGTTCQDGACKNTCGNGVKDQGEVCDGSDLGGQTCVTAGAVSGTLGCKPDCTADVSQCKFAPGGSNGLQVAAENQQEADLFSRIHDALKLHSGEVLKQISSIADIFRCYIKTGCSLAKKDYTVK